MIAATRRLRCRSRWTGSTSASCSPRAKGGLREPVSIAFASAIGPAALAQLVPWQRARLPAGAAVVLASCAVISGLAIGFLLVPSVVLSVIASSRV